MSHDTRDVEAANARFYRAFEALDLAEMDAVWLPADHVKCVHPGWPLLHGWKAVRRSWETIFASTAEARFSIADVSVMAGRDVAAVTCTENILSETSDRITVTSVLATNLFERTPDGWKMIHHHASHILGGAESL